MSLRDGDGNDPESIKFVCRTQIEISWVRFDIKELILINLVFESFWIFLQVKFHRQRNFDFITEADKQRPLLTSRCSREFIVWLSYQWNLRQTTNFYRSVIYCSWIAFDVESGAVFRLWSSHVLETHKTAWVRGWGDSLKISNIGNILQFWNPICGARRRLTFVQIGHVTPHRLLNVCHTHSKPGNDVVDIETLCNHRHRFANLFIHQQLCFI